MKTNYVDTVRGQLTVGASGRIMRGGEPTSWTMICRAPGQFRVVIAGTVSDDRCSCSQDAELHRLAERIAADDIEAAAVAKAEGGGE